jgi:hypothetical protein
VFQLEDLGSGGKLSKGIPVASDQNRIYVDNYIIANPLQIHDSEEGSARSSYNRRLSEEQLSPSASSFDVSREDPDNTLEDPEGLYKN